MSKDRCPYNSFFGEKVMIKEKLSLIWGKFVNRETISYLIFGVLTTLVDWISYAVFRHNGMNYRMATICCQAAAILFAYVTNKIWVEFQNVPNAHKHLPGTATTTFNLNFFLTCV